MIQNGPVFVRLTATPTTFFKRVGYAPPKWEFELIQVRWVQNNIHLAERGKVVNVIVIIGTGAAVEVTRICIIEYSMYFNNCSTCTIATTGSYSTYTRTHHRLPGSTNMSQ